MAIECVIGSRFDKWTVISKPEKCFQNKYWGCWCKCSCGRSKLVRVHHLRSGRSKSCGCRHGLSPKQYLMSKVKFNDNGCWEWFGAADSKGYGSCSSYGYTTSTHRLSYMLHFGEIHGDLHVCHRCDNPKCCNPDHLFLGTVKDNMQDRVDKDRVLKGSDHPNSKLTESLVTQARQEYDNGSSVLELANNYNITSGAMRQFLKQITWKHI